MRRSLMLVLAAALAVVVFAPTAFAQDDSPAADDPGGDDPDEVYDGVYIYDDNPTASATPSATVTSGVSASPRADARALPSSGGVPVLSVAAGLLLVGTGIVTAMLMRRTS